MAGRFWHGDVFEVRIKANEYTNEFQSKYQFTCVTRVFDSESARKRYPA